MKTLSLATDTQPLRICTLIRIFEMNFKIFCTLGEKY